MDAHIWILAIRRQGWWKLTGRAVCQGERWGGVLTCGWLTEGQMAKAPTYSGCPKEALSSCVRSHNAEERCPRSPRNPFLTVHVFPA